MSGIDFLWNAVLDAGRLFLSGDPEVISAVVISLEVSTLATLLCAVIGVPLGMAIATGRFTGRQLVITLLNTAMAIPTVVIGLFGYALLTRRSILGPLDLLFSPEAMILGQFLLGLPLVTALTTSAFATLDASVRETAITLGADRISVWRTMIWEGRFALMAAVAAGFGRLMGEVGISMMLGGNIAYQTRNITTSLALDTSKGDFARAMALGIFLLGVALSVNVLLRILQGRGDEQ